jgi:hypothetical protein
MSRHSFKIARRKERREETRRARKAERALMAKRKKHLADEEAGK